jgi:hypothetical protein
MPMIDVYPAAGTSASKHDLAQQLAAAAPGQVPLSRIARHAGKRRSVMPASTGSPIKTQVKKIHGLSVRYAESEPRDVSAILLSPWPESLYTFEQMWSRLAGEPRRVAAAARRAGTLVHRFSTARAIWFTARSPRPERGSGHG